MLYHSLDNRRHSFVHCCDSCNVWSDCSTVQCIHIRAIDTNVFFLAVNRLLVFAQSWTPFALILVLRPIAGELTVIGMNALMKDTGLSSMGVNTPVVTTRPTTVHSSCNAWSEIFDTLSRTTSFLRALEVTTNAVDNNQMFIKFDWHFNDFMFFNPILTSSLIFNIQEGCRQVKRVSR